MRAATLTIEWQHPRHGRIAEPVCAAHGRGVLASLDTLGIGCVGSPIEDAKGSIGCARCTHTGRVREWIHEHRVKS